MPSLSHVANQSSHVCLRTENNFAIPLEKVAAMTGTNKITLTRWVEDPENGLRQGVDFAYDTRRFIDVDDDGQALRWANRTGLLFTIGGMR
jgi:hypothetical protein